MTIPPKHPFKGVLEVCRLSPRRLNEALLQRQVRRLRDRAIPASAARAGWDCRCRTTCESGPAGFRYIVRLVLDADQPAGHGRSHLPGPVAVHPRPRPPRGPPLGLVAGDLLHTPGSDARAAHRTGGSRARGHPGGLASVLPPHLRPRAPGSPHPGHAGYCPGERLVGPQPLPALGAAGLRQDRDSAGRRTDARGRGGPQAGRHHDEQGRSREPPAGAGRGAAGAAHRGTGEVRPGQPALAAGRAGPTRRSHQDQRPHRHRPQGSPVPVPGDGQRPEQVPDCAVRSRCPRVSSTRSTARAPAAPYCGRSCCARSSAGRTGSLD